jgi:hypothetical protein
MECGTGGTSAQSSPRRSADELGAGIGQGRQDSRWEEASATAGISGPPTPLGGGTLLCLDWPQQEDELRDYEKQCATSEALVYAAMSRLMLRRLART